MNTLSTLIEPLGWALLHFLWQGAAVALLLRGFLWLTRRRSPQVRYAAAGAAMLLMLGSAVSTVCWLWPAPQADVAARQAGPAPVILTSPASPISLTEPSEAAVIPQPAIAPAGPHISPGITLMPSDPPPAEAPGTADRLRPLLPWMVGVWAAGVLFFSLRLLNGWRIVRRWRAAADSAIPGEWSQRFATLCERLGITRTVRLLSSATLAVPVVIGWLKPAVLVPASLFTGLTAAQLEALLAHELAHVRRHDYLVNLLQSALETLFFYHPAVWWVSGQLRKEREHCCDDAATIHAGGVLDYARALTALEEMRAMPAALGISAAGGSLLQRIRRLAGVSEQSASGLAWPLGLLTLAAVAAVLPFTLLHKAEAQEKESAAAKEDAPVIRGLSLSGVPSDTVAYLIPDLYELDPEHPGTITQKFGVFDMPIYGAEGEPWLKYPAGRGAFYIEFKNKTYGPIAGDPMEKLKLTLLLREKLKEDHPNDALLRLRKMTYRGDDALRSTAYALMQELTEPKWRFDYDELITTAEEALKKAPAAPSAAAGAAALAHVKSLADAAKAAWEKNRITLPDSDYQPGENVGSDTGILWTEPDASGMSLGYSGLIPGAIWRPGDQIEFTVWIRNDSKEPVKFSWTPRTDEGLRMWATDEKGVRRDVDIMMNTSLLVPNRTRLEPGQKLVLKKPQLLIARANEDGTAPQRANGDGWETRLALKSGLHRFQIEARIGSFESKDGQGHITVPAAGEWTGTLTSEELRVQCSLEPISETDRQAEGLYLKAYLQLLEADKLSRKGPTEDALISFRAVALALDQIAMDYPKWQTDIVEYRRVMIAATIAGLEKKLKESGEAKHKETTDLLKLWREEYKDSPAIPAAAMKRLAAQVKEYVEKNPGDAAEKMKPLLPDMEKEQPWAWENAQTVMDSLCDANTAPVAVLELNERFRSFDRVKPGVAKTTEELSKLPFGPAAKNGLSAAWVFDPGKDSYAVGEVLKCRITLHNSGKEPLEFRTDQWHRMEQLEVRDAAGKKVEVKSSWVSGITPWFRFKLEPGQVCEVDADGIVIGKPAGGEVTYGVEIPARPGDELTCHRGINIEWGTGSKDGSGGEGIPHYLTTGDVKFKVIAPDPNAAPTVGNSPPSSILQFRLVAGREEPDTEPMEPVENWSDLPTFHLRKTVILTAADVKSATAELDKESRETGKWQIKLVFSDEGGARLAKATKENLGRQLAIVGNGKVISAPVIQGEMGKQVTLSGNYLESEAKELVKAIEEAGSAKGAAMDPATDRRVSELVINVQEDGSIVWNGKSLTLEELTAQLTEIAKFDKKRAIIIRGKVTTPYEKFVAALNATRKAGLHHVSFATTTDASAPAKEAEEDKQPAAEQPLADQPLQAPQNAADETAQLKVAGETAQAFFKAATGEEKMKFHRLTDESRKLLAAHYQRHPAHSISDAVLLEGRFFPGGHILLMFDFPSLARHHFIEVFRKDGRMLVAWDTCSIYQEERFNDIQADTPKAPVRILAKVEPGDYYNGGFADAKRYQCYRLSWYGVDTSFYGYADRTSEAFAALEKLARLKGTRASLEIKYPADVKFKNQVEIVEVLDAAAVEGPDGKDSGSGPAPAGEPQSQGENRRSFLPPKTLPDVNEVGKQPEPPPLHVPSEEGTRTESVRKDGTLRESTYNKKGDLISVRVFTLDSKGRTRQCAIYDGEKNPLGSILFGYDPKTEQSVEERQFNKKGQLIRRLFYPGAIKDRPEFADKFVAFTYDPNRPNTKPVVEPGEARPTLPITDVKSAEGNEDVKRQIALAQGFYDLGQYEKARDAYEQILKLDPSNEEARKLLEQSISKLAHHANPFAVPADPKTLAEARQKSISLTVRDSTGTKPLPEFRVIAGVRSQAGGAGATDVVNWQPHTLQAGTAGGMLWPLDKAYDEMALRVEADGYSPQVFNWIEKKKGPQDLVFQMVESSGIPAQVLMPNGEPAVGATVALAMVQRDAVLEGGKLRHAGEAIPGKSSDRWRWPRFVKTNETGQCMLPAENDPTAALLIVHESGVREISLKDFLAGKDGSFVAGMLVRQLKLQPWGRIEGKVQWGDKPGAGQKVSLTIHRDTYGYPGVIAQYEKTTAAAEGTFVFEKVLPGRVQLSCPVAAEPGNKSGITEVNMTGQIAHVEVKPGTNQAVIGGGGRTVKGKLTGRDSWDGVTFHFHPTAPHVGFPGDDEMWKAWGELKKSASGPLLFREGLKVKADGTFEITGVLPGSYQIFFKREGEQAYMASGKFSVEAEVPGKKVEEVTLPDMKASPSAAPAIEPDKKKSSDADSEHPRVCRFEDDRHTAWVIKTFDGSSCTVLHMGKATGSFRSSFVIISRDFDFLTGTIKSAGGRKFNVGLDSSSPGIIRIDGDTYELNPRMAASVSNISSPIVAVSPFRMRLLVLREEGDPVQVNCEKLLQSAEDLPEIVKAAEAGLTQNRTELNVPAVGALDHDPLNAEGEHWLELPFEDKLLRWKLPD